jgi:cobalamin biosynthesis Mg chelatase CobN
MKKLLGFVLALILLLCLFGCSSTRKTIKEETSVTASQTEKNHSESDKTAASTTNTEVKTNTNVVVDFTKVEYNDGSSDLLTEYPIPEKVPENSKGSSQCKPPDKRNGIKSITSGRITINGNSSEKQETQAKTTEKSREDSKKSAEKEETDQKKGQQSPTFGYFAPVRAVFVLLIAFAVVVWWWRSRKG